jgi:hypothetical protein
MTPDKRDLDWKTLPSTVTLTAEELADWRRRVEEAAAFREREHARTAESLEAMDRLFQELREVR